VRRDSVDEIARRSQGVANATSWQPGRLIRRIDNFLPSGLMLGIVFQKAGQAGLFLPEPPRDQGLRRKGPGMTREWRSKPLKSLKTDSDPLARGRW
jgi:hypothetical protein